MSDTPLKRCRRCRKWKPATPEFFNRRKAGKNGLDPRCRKCRSVTRNNKKENAAARARYAADPEKVRAVQREWAAANPEWMRAIWRACSLRRLARKANLPYDWSPGFERAMLALWNNRCAYCGAPLDDGYEIEHFLPVSSGQGGTVPENLLPSCAACNGRKHAKDPTDWIVDHFGARAPEILSRIERYFKLWRAEAW